MSFVHVFFFKQKTAYEMRISDWSSDVCSSDLARLIGPAPARDSYLKADRVLQVASDCRADAIHPGYGLLSENAGFAEQVEAAGLTWIGPAPRSIRAMGDKQRARDIAAAAGVPTEIGRAHV